MDKFLTKSKVKDHSKCAVNVSAKDRVKSMPQVLHEDDGILLCSICNVSIDHTCKSTIDNHLKSKSHLKRKHKMDSEQSNTKVFKQTTVSSGFDKAAKKEPVETRWNTYFEAARYHASNMKYHKAFIDSENELLSHAPTKYLLLLKEILHDDNQMRKLQIQMSFLADKPEMLSKLLDHFQNHKATALDVHDKVEELQLYLDTNRLLRCESCSVYFDNKENMSLETKLELTEQFNEAFNDPPKLPK
nr:PREDICTED: uncharacterized protein LOC106703694 [Latimeria chalumnae]|eukprot:XP_014344512.1 PREDICTED: uncharacterized protein LOC106703694 [Latimeria chalumnae]